MIISFGASRNGPEVRDSIKSEGEFSRFQQADIPIAEGGAHFTTLHAAAELLILRQLSKEGLIDKKTYTNIKDIPQLDESFFDNQEEEIRLDTFSTKNGNNYGVTSPKQQYTALKQAIEARNKQGLPHEVEWTQLEASHALTKFAVENKDLSLGQSNNSLNIVILFGFSPKLPIPETYEEFKKSVDLAKSLENISINDSGDKIKINVTVGAAVLPQHMKKQTKSLDISDDKTPVGPLERIVAYASQPDSGVDIIRCGLEDTPCFYKNGSMTPTDNTQLVHMTREYAKKYNSEIITSPEVIASKMNIPRDISKTSMRGRKPNHL